jgi:hypothetical protein
MAWPGTPARPPNIRDLELLINGKASYLGVLVSTGSAVNNNTTATRFNYEPSATMTTLAGKTLLLQPTAAGHVMASASASMVAPNTVVATFSTVPPTAGTAPGVKLQAEERVNFVMASDEGWLQFIPTSGSANLFVWELL